MDQPVTPSLKWLLLIPVLLLVGFGGCSALLKSKVSEPSQVHRFVAPSTQTIHIEEPGTYVLWHDHRIVYQGTVYSSPPALPNQARIQLTHNDRPIAPGRQMNTSVAVGNHEKVEVMRFAIEQPGAYQLTVAELQEPRVMSFNQPDIMGWVKTIALVFAVSMIAWVGAPAVLIVVLVMRATHRRRSAFG